MHKLLSSKLKRDTKDNTIIVIGISSISLLESEKESVRNTSVETVTGDSSGADQWAIVPGQNKAQALALKGNNTNGCVSPNGFQVLQDIWEEGEIDEERR